MKQQAHGRRSSWESVPSQCLYEWAGGHYGEHPDYDELIEAATAARNRELPLVDVPRPRLNCEKHIAAWRREKDPLLNNALFNKMPKECQRLVTTRVENAASRSRDEMSSRPKNPQPKTCPEWLRYWRLERNPIRKNRIYDKMPESCRERITRRPSDSPNP